MVYLCAGMVRSGSTWLFNTVRMILTHAEVPDFVSGYAPDREKLLQHQNALMKYHLYRTDLKEHANVILTSHRDPRDVAASAVRQFKEEVPLHQLEVWITAYLRWAQVADYDLRYEDLLVDRLGEVRKIARVLRLPPDVVDRLPYEKILECVEGEKFGHRASEGPDHDAVNLLHKGHITDGRHGSWEGTLSPAYVAEIERKFRGWMSLHGYLAHEEPVGAGTRCLTA